MDELLSEILSLAFIIAIIVICVKYHKKKKKEPEQNIIFYDENKPTNKHNLSSNLTYDKSKSILNPIIHELEPVDTANNKEPTANMTNNNFNETLNNYYNIYSKKDYLLSKNELKFFNQLKRITNKYGLNIFTQVALYEIVETKNKHNYGDFNRIKSKTIDYVVADANCRIKLCIELDDPSHLDKDRQERDRFIEELFKQLNINLYRVAVQPYYNMQIVEEKIKGSL